MIRRAERQRGGFFLGLLVVAVLITILTVQPWAAGFRGLVRSVPAPAESLLTSVQNTISDDLSVFSDARQLRAQVDTLQAQNAQLRRQVAADDAAAHENAELRSALDFKRSSGLATVSAAVVGHGPDAFSRTLLIDRGSNSGLRPGMVVVSGSGLVGRLADVGPGSAVVTTLADTSSRVNVYAVASGVQGTVDGGPGALGADMLPALSGRAADGEWIETSGLGGQYPRGLLVGQVVGVVHSDASTTQRVWVAWVNDPSSLSMVLVITDFTPSQ